MDDLQQFRCQQHASGRRPSYIVYMTRNLTKGLAYVGKRTHTQKQQFESSSYCGSGKRLKKWKKDGDHLVTGILYFSTKNDLSRDERRMIDYARGQLGKQLVNMEVHERTKWKHWQDHALSTKADEKLQRELAHRRKLKEDET